MMIPWTPTATRHAIPGARDQATYFGAGRILEAADDLEDRGGREVEIAAAGAADELVDFSPRASEALSQPRIMRAWSGEHW